MSEIVRFKTEGGNDLLVEVDKPEVMGLQRAAKGGSIGDRVTDAAKSFDEAVDSVLEHAERVLEALEGLKPTSAELEFGIKLSAEAGAILAKAGGEANFNVKLTWDSATTDPPSQGSS